MPKKKSHHTKIKLYITGMIMSEIDIQIHEEGSTIPSIIENECRQLLVKNLTSPSLYPYSSTSILTNAKLTAGSLDHH